MKKAVVLLSGGLDSSVNFWLAHKKYEVVLGLTFNYGQKALAQELKSAENLCKRVGVAHKVIDLSWMKAFGHSALLSDSQTVPVGSAVEIDSQVQSEITAKAVWVPNRNGIFLNIAAGFAESYGADFVIPGFNVEEAATFADNSAEFMKALDHSFSFSTSNNVTVICETVSLNKTEIVKLGLDIGFFK
jgi:7-cyano-7-deazaguanine synthase